MKVAILDKPCLDHGLKGNSSGYGRFYDPSRKAKVLAHRLTFEREHGFLPEVVMHRCDNPRCIEITHLQAGTFDLNNKDRAAKGRSTKALVKKRKLSMDQAREIRERFALRKPGKDPVNGVMALARTFGVDPNVIYQIASGRTYR